MATPTTNSSDPSNATDQMMAVNDIPKEEQADSQEAASSASSHEGDSGIIIQLLYLNADQRRQQELIIDLIKNRLDCDIVVVLQSNLAEREQVCGELIRVTGHPWNFVPRRQEDNVNNICLYYNQQSVGYNVISVFNQEGRFIAISRLGSDTRNYGNLEIAALNLPLQLAERTTASTELLNYWTRAIEVGPAILIGNFNLKPDEINTLLTNTGILAFFDDQNGTNASQLPRFIDNAYASRNLRKKDIEGDLLGNHAINSDELLRHKAFTVSYQLNN